MLVTMATVAASVLSHGVTVAPGAKWYAATVETMGEGAETERTGEMPTQAGFASGSSRSG